MDRPEFIVGDTVIIDSRADSLPWISKRIGHGYLRMLHEGIIIGFTAAQDKAAVQFPEMIFSKKHDGYRSSFDNGCHNKGPIGYCLYIPVEFLHLKSLYSGSITFHKNNDDLLIIT